MSLPYTFANVSQLDTPNLDSNFNALGEFVTVQCTATGTNTITLTPVANAPVVTAYGLPYPVRFGFTAAASSTGSVTALVGALAALNLYLPSGSQATSGSLTIGTYYEVVYLAALNSGAGGFIIVSAIATAAGTAGASVSGLKIVNNSSTPNTEINVTATNAVMITTAGVPFFASSISVTINCGTTGANGLDTGSLTTSTFYYIYLISNGSTTAGLASLSSTAPTLPSGYTYKYRVGAMVTDSSSHFMRTLQQGRRAQYTLISGSNTTAYPQLPTVGASGTYTSSTFTGTSESLAGLVPATASRVALQVISETAGQQTAVAPNLNFGGYTSSNPPPIQTVTQGSNSGEFELENPTATTLPGVIYYASSGSSAIAVVMGWEDNI
jgi:hypothetical protein